MVVAFHVIQFQYFLVNKKITVHWSGLTSLVWSDLMSLVWPHESHLTSVWSDLMSLIWPHQSHLTSSVSSDLISLVWPHRSGLTWLVWSDLISLVWPYLSHLTLLILSDLISLQWKPIQGVIQSLNIQTWTSSVSSDLIGHELCKWTIHYFLLFLLYGQWWSWNRFLHFLIRKWIGWMEQ